MPSASIYEQSMALQSRIDSMPKTDGILHAAAIIGLNVINHRWDASLIRVARSSSAYFIDDKLTGDSYMNPSQKFGEVVLKGLVPRVTCVEIDKRLVVALPFYEPVVLGPSQEIETELVELELDECDAVLPLDTPIRRPLFTPVEDLSFILLAA